MKRITISLPDDLAAVLREEAHRRSSSVSATIRSTLFDSLVGETPRALPFASICDDPALPAGSQIDQALEAEWPDDLDRDRR